MPFELAEQAKRFGEAVAADRADQDGSIEMFSVKIMCEPHRKMRSGSVSESFKRIYRAVVKTNIRRTENNEMTSENCFPPSILR